MENEFLGALFLFCFFVFSFSGPPGFLRSFCQKKGCDERAAHLGWSSESRGTQPWELVKSGASGGVLSKGLHKSERRGEGKRGRALIVESERQKERERERERESGTTYLYNQMQY